MNPIEKGLPCPEFDTLAIGAQMQIRASALTPKILDDGTLSYNSGPLEVYRGARGNLIIHNGNHKYYREKEKAKPGSDPVFDCMKIEQVSDLDEILLDRPI